MKKFFLLIGMISLNLVLADCASQTSSSVTTPSPAPGKTIIALPTPEVDGSTSVEQALVERRSVREYRDEPLSLPEIGQLLWAAQGVTSPSGKRTAPSAGALYPLELYLVAGDVEGLQEGVYKYIPHDHALKEIAPGDNRSQLTNAALKQESIQKAPAVIVLSAVFERTRVKYGNRGDRYVHMEIGFSAQSIYLQAEALELGTVFIGAFNDDSVKKIMGMQDDEQALGIMPLGVQ
ncbi:SagB/ThcOx family dehydrogenase [Chloroflexota bacterium]